MGRPVRSAAQHHQTSSSGQQTGFQSGSNASLEVVGIAAGTAGTHILADAQIAVLVPGLLAFVAVVRALAIRVHLAGQQLQRCRNIVQILKPSVPCKTTEKAVAIPAGQHLDLCMAAVLFSCCTWINFSSTSPRLFSAPQLEMKTPMSASCSKVDRREIATRQAAPHTATRT